MIKKESELLGSISIVDSLKFRYWPYQRITNSIPTHFSFRFHLVPQTKQT